jgi:hypothetical protein
MELKGITRVETLKEYPRAAPGGKPRRELEPQRVDPWHHFRIRSGMAGPLKIEIPGAWRHAMALGNERRAIFRGDCDYARLVEILEEMAGRFRVLSMEDAIVIGRIVGRGPGCAE